MQTRFILSIFFVVLIYNVALPQDSSELVEQKDSSLTERIDLFENEIFGLKKSIEYIILILILTSPIVIFIAAIAITINYIFSKRKIIDTIDIKIKEQIKLIDAEKNEAVGEIKTEYNKKFSSMEITQLLSSASINRTMRLATSTIPLTSLLWLFRVVSKLEEVRISGDESVDIQLVTTSIGIELKLAISIIKKLKAGSLTDVSLYREINKIMNAIDRTEFKRELKLLDKGIDKIYYPKSNSE